MAENRQTFRITAREDCEWRVGDGEWTALAAGEQADVPLSEHGDAIIEYRPAGSAEDGVRIVPCHVPPAGFSGFDAALRSPNEPIGDQMNEKREPVLSDEQWATIRHGTGSAVLTSGIMLSIVHWGASVGGLIFAHRPSGAALRVEPADAAPLAAVLLDMLGIVSREDVDRLRRSAFDVPDGWSGNPWMADLADRLEPYLPPPVKED